MELAKETAFGHEMSVSFSGGKFHIDRRDPDGSCSRRVDHSEEMVLWALTILARKAGLEVPSYEEQWPIWVREKK